MIELLFSSFCKLGIKSGDGSALENASNSTNPNSIPNYKIGPQKPSI